MFESQLTMYLNSEGSIQKFFIFNSAADYYYIKKNLIWYATGTYQIFRSVPYTRIFPLLLINILMYIFTRILSLNVYFKKVSGRKECMTTILYVNSHVRSYLLTTKYGILEIDKSSTSRKIHGVYFVEGE